MINLVFDMQPLLTSICKPDKTIYVMGFAGQGAREDGGLGG